jgi:hypothetical protein
LNATNTPVTLLITVDAAEGGLSFLIDRTVPPNVTINYNFYQTNLSSIGSHGDPNVAVNPTCTTVINFDMTNNSFYNQATGQNEIVNHGNMSQATLGPVISILASYLFQYY